MLEKGMRVYIAGHAGMVGSAIARALDSEGFTSVTSGGRAQLDLVDQAGTQKFFEESDINYVVAAAAKVGGIHANNEYPAEFIYDNLMIECNLVNCAYRAGIHGLLFLGSSCIYPKLADQPMQENALLTGPLEPTNEPYAIAKIAGIKMCESYNRQYGVDYRSVMPTNLYGPNDNYAGEDSHVIPALIKKFHAAKMADLPCVDVWGSGKARREFLHVDDLARACVHVMTLPGSEYQRHTEPMLSHLNVGYGEDVTIGDLAHLMRGVTGYRGDVVFDVSKPDGAPRKLLDSSKLRSLGWRPRINLEDGLADAYEDYLRRQGPGHQAG